MPEINKKIKESLLKFSLQNGSKFEEVNPGAVISKVIGEHPEVKKQIKEVQKELQRIIKEVNDLSKEERTEKLKELAPELLEKKEAERREGLKDLPNAGKKVVLRFAPSPSGPLHIGHAYILGLNSQYKNQYKGKLILRLEDTNPDNLEPDAYRWIPEDANWLTENSVDEVIIQSDRIDIYNAYTLKLLEEGHAYVCTCSSDVFKEKLDNKSLCECRKNTEKKNLERWHHMLTDWDDGDAVVRFKTDPDEKNPAFKEFPLARINTSEHPRQGLKYRVWPLMNLSVAVDDYELGITHAVRGKDHTDNAKKQAMIAKALKASTPESVSVGLISFQGFDLSTTQTKKTIKEGGYKGWDDIRLPFLRAMRRKGYQAGALRKFAITMGVTLTDKSVSQEEFFKTLNAFNKEVIDPVANRYFAVVDPVVITIKNAPNLDIESDLQPDNKKGGRNFKTHENFYIEKDDFKNIKDGELIRLMGCLNFVKKGKTLTYVSKEYGEFKGQGTKQIHWLPQDQSQLIKIKIKLNDNKDVEAFAEKAVEKVRENDMVQFERFGFCRCDTKNGFWFTHR